MFSPPQISQSDAQIQGLFKKIDYSGRGRISWVSWDLYLSLVKQAPFFHSVRGGGQSLKNRESSVYFHQWYWAQMIRAESRFLSGHSDGAHLSCSKPEGMVIPNIGIDP